MQTRQRHVEERDCGLAKAWATAFLSASLPDRGLVNVSGIDTAYSFWRRSGVENQAPAYPGTR